MTTESSKLSAITLCRMNFSGYVGHVTTLSSMLTLRTNTLTYKTKHTKNKMHDSMQLNKSTQLNTINTTS